jgi:maltose O-acetyltransferase
MLASGHDNGAGHPNGIIVAILSSLNRLRPLRLFVTGLRKRWLLIRYGVVVDQTASISLSAQFISPHRGLIIVGKESLVAFKTLLIADAGSGNMIMPITIGQRCFIGGGSMILPGVTIGNESIVAAGAVVTQDVPPRCIVAGNPARIVRSDINVGRFGRLAGADEGLFAAEHHRKTSSSSLPPIKQE